MVRLGTVRGFAILGLALLIPACGGGGGGGGVIPDSVQFSAATYTVAEGAATVQATITVTRTGGSGAVSVNYATSNGSATTAAGDYTATSGTLTWAAGAGGAQTFDVPILTDAAIEGDETIGLTLSLVSGGAALGTQKTATLTVTDDDAPLDGVFQFSSATYTVSEGAGATVQATITVTRTAGTTGTVAAAVTTSDGTATAADYTTPTPNPVILNFADGDGVETFTIDILDSASAGGTHTVNLALSIPAQPGTEAPVVGTVGNAVLTIINRDVAGTVRLTSNTDSVFESGGLATFTAQRIDGTMGAGSVDVSVTPLANAVPGTDYTVPAPTITLNWADGDFADKTFTLAVIDNAIIDLTRTVTVALTNPGGVALSAPSSTTLTILDDEPGSVAFSSATYTIAEGNAGTSQLTITATRTGGSLGIATVQVVDLLTGTATLGDNDYEQIDSVGPSDTVTLTWPNGTSGDQSFTITINGDGTVEPDETIELQLQNPTGTALGLQQTATATITNEDVPANGSFQFDPAGVYTVLESAGSIVLTIQRVGGSAGVVGVTVTTSNGSAKSNGKPSTRDYVANTQILPFGAGVTSQTFTVNVNQNPDGDVATETFNVTLSAPTGGATIGGAAVQVVTITDVP